MEVRGDAIDDPELGFMGGEGETLDLVRELLATESFDEAALLLEESIDFAVDDREANELIYFI